MDPTATLLDIRKRIDEFENIDPWRLNAAVDCAALLIEHVRALDQWMARGGFLPDQWNTQARPQAHKR